MNLENVLQAAQDIPVLVQGVLASAIFWALLKIGQIIASHSSSKVRTHLLTRQKYLLFNEIFRASAKISNTESAGTHYAAVLWYRASRNVVLGLIWLAVGLLLNTFIEVIGVIGFTICIYQFIAAHNILKPYVYEGDSTERIKELKAQVAEIETKLANTSR